MTKSGSGRARADPEQLFGRSMPANVARKGFRRSLRAPAQPERPASVGERVVRKRPHQDDVRVGVDEDTSRNRTRSRASRAAARASLGPGLRAPSQMFDGCRLRRPRASGRSQSGSTSSVVTSRRPGVLEPRNSCEVALSTMIQWSVSGASARGSAEQRAAVTVGPVADLVTNATDEVMCFSRFRSIRASPTRFEVRVLTESTESRARKYRVACPRLPS